MKQLFTSLTVSLCLVLPTTGAVFATGQPGAPNVTCGSPGAELTPGNAGSAINPTGTNGSPFNPAVPKTYAGNPGNPTTSNGQASANAISQYDIACKNVTSKQMP